MKLTITIQLDNAAFGDTAEERSAEVKRILEHKAHAVFVKGPGIRDPLFDLNGNKVGSFVVTR